MHLFGHDFFYGSKNHCDRLLDYWVPKTRLKSDRPVLKSPNVEMLRASTSIRRFLCSISNKWRTIPSPLIIIVVVFILSFFYLICWTCCWKLPIVSSQQTLIEVAQEVKYTQVLNKLIEWLTKSSLHPTSIVTSKLESPHGDLERRIWRTSW